MDLRDFVDACEHLLAQGFTVLNAEYSSEAFGSWSIEFSSKTVRRHRLIWDGRDRWLTLQDERPEPDRTVRISFEELRRMSYEDGVTAYAQRQSDEWKDKWIGKIDGEQSINRALEQL